MTQKERLKIEARAVARVKAEHARKLQGSRDELQRRKQELQTAKNQHAINEAELRRLEGLYASNSVKREAIGTLAVSLFDMRETLATQQSTISAWERGVEIMAAAIELREREAA